ncbi:MAG: chromosome segregation protein SMC [Acetobacterium sp.]
MYLKKLHISGFKSFADPVSLEFSQGISAIVGPNGSGKSNITDAIKWVMGEQSIKSLRGKKMEDVIFSGTDKKSATGYAEVVLVMDNTDGFLTDYPQEVAISRKLFRSGESDYAINKKSCKLKEVHSIFMDTGLGKNGYSLISQGGIENIIASSPSELRSIFEEAVGIVSYKTKKNEAEKKLEQTQNHLDRLRDIMVEIEKQLGPLKNQSRKAKTWLTLHEELKTVDLVIFYEKMTTAVKDMGELQKNFKSQLELCDADEKNIEEKDGRYQKLTIQNRELESLLDAGKRTLATLRADYEQAQQEDIRCKSQFEANTITQERMHKELSGLAIEITENQGQISALKQKVEQKKALLSHDQGKQTSLEETLKALLVEEQNEKERELIQHAAIISNQSQREVVEERLLKLRMAISETKTEADFVSKRLAGLTQDQTLNREITTALKTEAQKLGEEKSTIKTKQQRFLEVFNQTAASQKDLIGQGHTLSNNMKVNASKTDYLKNIQKNYQDYFPAIRKLMTSEKILGEAIHQVYGPVGELISIDSRFIQAIDIALGGKSQNIVVANVKIASDCINLLKAQRLGRATFLPLDNLRYSLIDQRTRSQLQGFDGFEGIASELVKTPETYVKAIDSLLGRTIVATDFRAGKEIQKNLQGKFTVVTLEGEIFYPGGAIVGGQKKDSRQSPLFKKVEIENLEKEMIRQEVLLKKIHLQEQSEARVLSDYRDELKELEVTINLYKQKRWENNKQAETLTHKTTENSQAINDLKEKNKLLENNLDMLSGEMLEAEKSHAAIKQPLEETPAPRAVVDDIRLKLDALREVISVMQMKVTQNNGEINGFEQQIHLIDEQLNRQSQRKMALEQELFQYEKKSIELIQRQKILETETIKLSEVLAKHRDKSKAAFDQQKENTRQLEKLRNEIKIVNHDLIIHNDQKNKLETKISSLQINMDHWEEAIYKSYELNYLMVEDIYEALADKKNREGLDLSEERQRALKRKINALGNVNLSAIADYTEIVERHAFMKEQMDDLQAGKRELLDIINTLYDAMTDQFKEKFIILQEKFTRIFGILFEGGRAYLEFTDPTGILEGGIELVAQPPGKRLRHISLLSGGEKSMVAIALLFSFLEINPSPFCVIDEIDAALDDHNIYRYISYLKKIAKNNQFITITHRLKTLEVCDNLYGVSMSRDGVSQLVSVRLSDYI